MKQKTYVIEESANAQVLVLKDKVAKKGPRYSKGKRLGQEFRGAMLAAVRRVTKGVDKGLDTYIERREASAVAKKDGATKDRFRNVARAARTFSSHAAEAPAEFFEQIADMRIGKRIAQRVKKMRR